MSASSTISTARSLIDLPADIVFEVMDLVSNESLKIDSAVLNLLLTHRRLLEAADQRVAEHQLYLIKYKDVVIDATNAFSESLEEITRPTASSASYSSVSTTFDSPLKMLFAIHQDRWVAKYVRSLTYLPPSGNLKHALRSSKTPLELFDQNQAAVDVWNDEIDAIVDSILPTAGTRAHRNSWLEALLQQDNGQGINTLLSLLPHLEYLTLTGPESRWKLSLHRITSIPKSFHAHMFQYLEEIEIHCGSKKIHWFSDDDRLAFLDVPNVKIVGYWQNPVCLAVAIASADYAKFTRLECTFIYSSHLKDFISKFGGAFRCPRLLLPKFSSTADGSIKMVLEPEERCTFERSRSARSVEEERLRRHANMHRLNKLGNGVPITKELRNLLNAHKKAGGSHYPATEDEQVESTLLRLLTGGLLRLSCCGEVAASSARKIESSIVREASEYDRLVELVVQVSGQGLRYALSPHGSWYGANRGTWKDHHPSF